MDGREEVLELYDVYAGLRGYLETLLGFNLDNQKRPVAKDFRRALDDINSGRLAFAEFKLLRLSRLVADLDVIRDHGNPGLFEDFRRRLVKCDKPLDWYGVRFEAHTAARLVERGIVFEKSDPPDFTVPVDGVSLYVECGSTHASNVCDEVKLHERLRRVIRRKSGKGYAGSGTALFVDISSCVSEAARKGYSGFSLTFPETVRQMLVRDSFGSVLLFHYLIRPLGENPSPQYVYGANVIDDAWTRVDATAISPELRSFLDRYYPTRDKPVRCQWWTMKEG